jgi:hypothetical protein
MPIKLKNIPATEPFNPLQKHLNNILALSKEKLEYAEKRLQAACIATDLIKKNTDTPEKASKGSDPLKTAEAKDNLTVLSAAVDKTAQVNQENQPTINEYLSNLDNLRKENQLIYGKRLGEPNLSLGFGLTDTSDALKVPYYKKKLLSTNSFTYQGEHSNQMGAVEFAITYDNKIFIVPKSEGAAANNLYRMTQGTLLKAIGCIQIGDREVIENTIEGGLGFQRVLEGQVKYISVYNAFFDAQKDNIAVALFALQRLDIDLGATKVVIPNDDAPLITHTDPDCRIAVHGEIKNASYYLNENHFPHAKALAENQLTFFDKLVELFCTLDDEFLEKRNKKFLEEIYGEKELLKLNLIKLFNCAEDYINETEKKIKKTKIVIKSTELVDQPSTSFQPVVDKNIEIKDGSRETTVSFNDYWLAIKASIQFFKEKNIDLSFLVHEINMILAYTLQNSLTRAEKNQLEELALLERIPGRGLDVKNISSFISFYEHDPIKTCINLLRDYSKGQGLSGALKRFFSLAWNRHYVSSVNQFLRAYDRQELPDNLSVYDIFSQLRNYGAEISLQENKSTLLSRLLFCAKLNREESDFIPELVDVERDLGSVSDNAPVQQPSVLGLKNVGPRVIPINVTQPVSVPTAIAITPPPLPIGESPTGSAELLINRTKIGSYQETSENKFFHEQVRPRSASMTSKKNPPPVKFFIGAEGDNTDVIKLEQRSEVANSACPPSPGMTGL